MRCSNIDLDPVRTVMAVTPWRYRWSSVRLNAEDRGGKQEAGKQGGRVHSPNAELNPVSAAMAITPEAIDGQALDRMPNEYITHESGHIRPTWD